MRRILALLVLVVLFAPVRSHCAGDPAVAARFINALGLDVLSKATAPDQNALLSPYSVQSALAMTYAGADGETKHEMATVLHYPDEPGEPHESLHELQSLLDRIAAETAKDVAARGSGDPITYVIANRLFGQDGYEFRESFTTFVQQKYNAPMQLMDFKHSAEKARNDINAWVETQTRQRIRDLIPGGALNTDTRLILVNAIYLKAPWSQPFSESATQPRSFHIDGGAAVNVPTMRQERELGLVRRDGYTAITIPYLGDQLQFLILLPYRADGLKALEKQITPEVLAELAALSPVAVLLELPKLKMEPPVMALAEGLEELGMKTAFDEPQGSANFDGIAPRRPDDYLSISGIFHKTFLALDEKGTEAAAATAVAMVESAMKMPRTEPIEVKVDHPFLFAIQHRASGACLFLGRVVDPR